MLNWIVWNRTVFCIKMDLTLNTLQWLICRKTKPNHIIIIIIIITGISSPHNSMKTFFWTLSAVIWKLQLTHVSEDVKREKQNGILQVHYEDDIILAFAPKLYESRTAIRRLLNNSQKCVTKVIQNVCCRALPLSSWNTKI